MPSRSSGRLAPAEPRGDDPSARVPDRRHRPARRSPDATPLASAAHFRRELSISGTRDAHTVGIASARDSDDVDVDATRGEIYLGAS